MSDSAQETLRPSGFHLHFTKYVFALAVGLPHSTKIASTTHVVKLGILASQNHNKKRSKSAATDKKN